IVVYPEGVWYTYVDEDDVDEIIDEHLQHGRVVERLRLKGGIGDPRGPAHGRSATAAGRPAGDGVRHAGTAAADRRHVRHHAASGWRRPGCAADRCRSACGDLRLRSQCALSGCAG